PVALPEGNLQFHTQLPSPQNNNSMFIVSSHSPGLLYVVTNNTDHTNAYYIEHPGIEDVIMLTDEFFCSPFMCFYINGVIDEGIARK
ncbi:hypothetical protein PENTCL1PPCAC_286, partial [Pristionchus entomophagus]